MNHEAVVAALRDRGDVRKSSRSAGQTNCVGVNGIPGWVGVRDTKDPDGPILAFPARTWGTFITETSW